jgi:hypothetical protein
MANIELKKKETRGYQRNMGDKGMVDIYNLIKSDNRLSTFPRLIQLVDLSTDAKILNRL